MIILRNVLSWINIYSLMFACGWAGLNQSFIPLGVNKMCSKLAWEPKRLLIHFNDVKNSSTFGNFYSHHQDFRFKQTLQKLLAHIYPIKASLQNHFGYHGRYHTTAKNRKESEGGGGLQIIAFWSTLAIYLERFTIISHCMLIHSYLLFL